MANEFEPPGAQLGPLASSDIEALELLRRSPHPYHRRQADLRSSQPSSSDVSRTTLSPTDRTISDEDDRKRRKTTTSPSDSGTEADDEGYGLVKALPAPPIRPRKGLRDSRGFDGGASPLLTPSRIDEEGRRFSAEYFKAGKSGSRSGTATPTDEEARAARQKYLKRRRAELVRRTTETALLGAIGALAVQGCGCWQLLLRWHRVELLTYLAVVVGLLGVYPLRLLRYSSKRESSPEENRTLRQRIRIPAAFDPATILYPTIIPVLISISLLRSNQKILLPNIVLALSALPYRLIPYGAIGSGYSTIHWFIAALPLVASQNTELPSKILAPMPYMLKLPPPEGLDPEIIVTLFALHHALLPPLRYLTTTSLLAAELQLLSIGLINLYLFADSPQTEILKTLLWLGGVGLFVLTGRVLKWGVALARIPRWRFRRAGQIIKARQSFLQALNDGLKRGRSRSTAGGSDSDADEDGFPLLTQIKSANYASKLRNLKVNTLDAVRRGSVTGNGNESHSAVESQQGTLSKEGGGSNSAEARRRRNTLPSLQSPNHTTTPHPRRQRSKSIAQAYLSLTPAQATIRKWLYAGYFYLVVGLMILVPIRFIISKYALHKHEPFGWALGYLLGQIQPLRFFVVHYDLESWIALPPMLDPDDMAWAKHLGKAEYLRKVVFGEANTRLLLCGYCLAVIIVGLIAVFRLTSVVEVDTRRKVFHGTMVAMLLPTIYIDPAFISLALSLVLAIFLLLDLIRASQLPPLSGPIASFLTPYVDGRDLRGPVVISHIFLLIGCAIPLWLSLAGVQRTGEEPWIGWDVQTRDVSMIAGVVCVGMGDAAASLIGRRYGRRKWPWAGGKSLEGSLAFAAAVTIGLVFGKLWLRVGQWDEAVSSTWIDVLLEAVTSVAKAGLCACGASLNEAVLTGGNDNVIVPVLLWVLVRGVRL